MARHFSLYQQKIPTTLYNGQNGKIIWESAYSAFRTAIARQTEN